MLQCTGILSAEKAPVPKPHYEGHGQSDRQPHPAMIGHNSVPYPLQTVNEDRPPELPASPPPMHPPTLSPDMEDVRVSEIYIQHHVIQNVSYKILI